jgi:hypothetical protein
VSLRSLHGKPGLASDASKIHTTEQGNPMNQPAPKPKPINIYEMTLDELRTALVRMVNETTEGAS